MKIALIVPGGVDRSGSERVIPALLALIKRLAVCHEVHVYALWQQREAGEWMLCGAAVHSIGSGYGRLRAVQRIRSEHRVGRFGLVQSFFSGSCGLIAVSVGRLLGIPSFIHVAGGELVSLKDIGYGGRLTWKGRVREWLVLRAATAVTAPSAPMIAALAQLGVHAQRVPLGVDQLVWPRRLPSPRAVEEPPNLLHVGSLNPVKDQSTLLRTFAMLVKSKPDLRLDVVGEDTLQGQMQAQAHEMGLGDRVTFHGFLTQAQLRPLMERSHMLIVSSRHEAGPIVMLEAAMVGVPTVGTTVGHIAEWAPDAALAAPVGDAAGLAALIDTLLTDEQRRLRIAAKAQHRALQEDADFTASRLEQIYATLGCS